MFKGFKVYPDWEIVNMFLYSIVPFLLMTICNVLLMKKTWFMKGSNQSLPSNKQIIKSHEKRKRATASQLLLSSLFLAMTLPTTFAYGIFFHLKSEFSLIFAFLDYLLFFHNSALFLRCFFSYRRFRQIVTRFFSRIAWPLRIIHIKKKNNDSETIQYSSQK